MTAIWLEIKHPQGGLAKNGSIGPARIRPGERDPVPAMKAWLLERGAAGEARWRPVANGKEQDFRHIIDFIDEDGETAGAYEYLPKWLRPLGTRQVEASPSRTYPTVHRHMP